MPGIGLQQGLRQGLEQQLVLQQALRVGDRPRNFRTDAEELQVSQYEVLQKLAKVISDGEFFDQYHFELETNRTIFGHPLEARLGNFGRDLSTIIHTYGNNEEAAKQIIDVLDSGNKKEKDLPEKVAAGWNRILGSGHFDEQKDELLTFIRYLADQDADVSSGIDLVARTAEKSKDLAYATLEKVSEYAGRDARLIPFSHEVISQIMRSTGIEDARLFTKVVEPLYMLDSQLRVSDTIGKVATYLAKQGVSALEDDAVPIPIQAHLETVQPDTETYQQFVQFCQENDFTQGRERQRNVYRGVAALEDFDNAYEIFAHITKNVRNARGLSRLLAQIELVSKEPDFSYDFNLKGEEAVSRNLRLQLVDKSIKRLQLDDNTLEKYLDRIEKDDRFREIGKIATTLASYSHYQNPEQIGLLREVVQAELAGEYGEWRYSDDKADKQLAVLGNHRKEWKENIKVSRLVGDLDALESHIDSVKGSLPKIVEIYESHYQQKFDTEIATPLQEKIAQNEEALRSAEMKKSETKRLGFETHQLREHLTYVKLLYSLGDLTTDNYEATLQQAGEIAKKKSQHPLYDPAKWIKGVLDEPVYRDTRKITVEETDDLETMLRFGERPVPHCQNWKVNSNLNKTLMSFVADANKKLYHIYNGSNTPISMSMVRLVDWDETPTLLIENVYANEWSDDYGIALLGSVAKKASAIAGETGKEVRVAVPNRMYEGKLSTAMERFSKINEVEIHEDGLRTKPAKSRNPEEYWDSGPGIVGSGRSVSLDVNYIAFKAGGN